MTQQDTDEESEMVWYTRGERTIYHTDPDCDMLKQTTKIRKVEKKLLPNFRCCIECKDGIRHDHSPPVRECGLCGQEYQEIPDHLRNCPER